MKPKCIAFACAADGTSPITAESSLYGRRVLKTAVKRLVRHYRLTEVSVGAYEERRRTAPRLGLPRGGRTA